MSDLDGLRSFPDEPYYRLGPVHTCLYVRACRLVTGTSSWVPWNGRGRRLVALTDGRYSEGHSHGLPEFIHPRVLGRGYPLKVFNKNSTLTYRQFHNYW